MGCHCTRLDEDGDGFVSEDDIFKFLVYRNFSLHEAEVLWRAFDAQERGFIDFVQFGALYHKFESPSRPSGRSASTPPAPVPMTNFSNMSGSSLLVTDPAAVYQR